MAAGDQFPAVGKAGDAQDGELGFEGFCPLTDVGPVGLGPTADGEGTADAIAVLLPRGQRMLQILPIQPQGSKHCRAVNQPWFINLQGDVIALPSLSIEPVGHYR